MSQSELHNLLKQLHSSLGNGPSLDAEDRQLLGTVLTDIERTLAQGTAAQPSTEAGLESLAVKFEADHPQLAEALRRLVDSLGKAGI